MYYRRKRKTNNKWKYALYTFIAGAAVAVIAFCGNSLKKELEAAQAVQGQPYENHDSYYSADENSSQETQGGAASSAKPENHAAIPSPAPSPSVEGYLVTVYEGKIAVFKENETKPMQILDIPLSMLPEEDISILKKGIRAENIGELKRILEDYE